MEVQQNIRAKSIPSMRIYIFFALKRILDISISLFLLVLLSPLILIICVCIHQKEGKPTLFKQVRVGKHNRPFVIWKFRTMTNSSKVIRALPPHPFPSSWSEGVPNEFVFKTKRTSRVTNLGAWLRKFSLDELPQLFNVLKGDMSLVGPRPEIPEIAQHYNKVQQKRLTIKPGMTGYAQVNGRSNINHGQKIEYDLYYVENCSLRLDMKIIFRTILQVIRAKGAI